MAGRGRGKSSMSFIIEQLGFNKGDILPPPVLQPPPSYPLLEHRPSPITLTNEMNYLLELKRDYAEYMRESSNNVVPIVPKKDIERYSDCYQDIITDKTQYDTKYDWSRIPQELKSSQKRKAQRAVRVNVNKKQKITNIETKLAELEQKENVQQDVEEQGKEEEAAQEKEEDEFLEDEEEELDEEMDEGTDYVNNYFDNGEGYDDEEDNLDDGPIY